MKKKYDNDYWMIPSDYSQLDHFVANYLGINEAIVLRLIYSMCRYKKQQYGTSWFQGSWIFWKSKLKFMSESKLRRVFDSLEKKGLIQKRVDYKTGNWYQPVQTAIEKMLKEARDDYFDDSFELSENESIQSVQNEQADSELQNEPVQNEQASLLKTNKQPVHNEQALLTSMSPISPRSLPNVATAHAAATQEPVTELVTEVLDSKPEKQKTAGALIFEAYQDAYVQRYGLEPLRNAKTNSICAQIAKQLPVDEARALMHFFVQQNVAFYLQRGHAIQLALADLQALRTNMLQNKAMSAREAFLADKQQAQKNVLDDYLANREKYQKMFIP